MQNYFADMPRYGVEVCYESLTLYTRQGLLDGLVSKIYFYNLNEQKRLIFCMIVNGQGTWKKSNLSIVGEKMFGFFSE